MKWERIDFDERTVTVPISKNGESRVLPIKRLAWSYLLELRAARIPDSKLVFHGRDINTPLNIEKAWATARLKSGIKNFRWHDNRHTAAAYFRKSGASIADIADILGHKTLTVAWRYSKIEVEEQRPQFSAMNDKFLPNDLIEQAQNANDDNKLND